MDATTNRSGELHNNMTGSTTNRDGRPDVPMQIDKIIDVGGRTARDANDTAMPHAQLAHLG